MMPPEMTVQHRVRVTPELARRFLQAVTNAGRTNYRKTRPYWVNHYARQMQAGRWIYTASRIHFDRDGLLVDGFHRLEAVVLTGVTIEVDIVLNTPPEVIELLDRGNVRTDADVAEFRGHTDAKNLIAWTGRLLEWENGVLGSGSRLRLFDPQDKLAMYEADPDLGDEATSMGRKIWSATHINKAMASAFYWQVAQIDREAAARFCELLVSGAHLDNDDPILALRNWAINRWGLNQKTTEEEWAHALTKAWNKWRKNEPIKMLRISVSGHGSNRTPLPDLV